MKQEGQPGAGDTDRAQEGQAVQVEDVHGRGEQGQQDLEEEERDQAPAAQYADGTTLA